MKKAKISRKGPYLAEVGTQKCLASRQRQCANTSTYSTVIETKNMNIFKVSLRVYTNGEVATNLNIL